MVVPLVIIHFNKIVHFLLGKYGVYMGINGYILYK